ncbi:hypothetical protein [Halocynthiibacter namhaensis]|uniref:hypothetical protein n=1 Tax=Halocynthiibacter namhaensis TaxID=1290553 RepID=UPI00068FCDA8|nr:hypothetical protein [Halocynthiibacter namhaensis]
MAKGYKSKKRGAGRHVQLPEWLMQTEAWSTLPLGPRCLYVEMKRRYTGSNNGNLMLSHREAAVLLCVSKNTIGPYFRELETRGFISTKVSHCLGPSGIGKTTRWVLTEYPTADLKPAKKTFAAWRVKTKAPPKKGDTTYL